MWLFKRLALFLGAILIAAIAGFFILPGASQTEIVLFIVGCVALGDITTIWTRNISSKSMKMGTGFQNPSPALLLCSVRLKSFASYFIGFHHNEECFFILVFDRLLYIVHFFIAARTHYNQFIIP